MIRPLCKQFKQSAMPGPVKRITPNAGGVVCPSKSKACAYAWGNGRDCGAGKVCYVRPRGGDGSKKKCEVETMAARLTDRQKKKILADYVQTNNYCATAKINGVSATTVKNLVRANADIVEKCEQKKEENTADVMEYMNDHKDLVCAFIGKGLEMLNDPEKLAAANLSQITTAMGTLIDKWAMVQEKTGDNNDDGVMVVIDV